MRHFYNIAIMDIPLPIRTLWPLIYVSVKMVTHTFGNMADKSFNSLDETSFATHAIDTLKIPYQM